MITSVCRAFFQAGCLNAGTPLEIASTPVTAAPPEAKAWSTSKSLTPSSSPTPVAVPQWIWPSTRAVYSGRSPEMYFTSPRPSRTPMLTMKK